MGASKRSFAEQREIENLISRIKHNKGSEFNQMYNSAKLVNKISPGYIGDLGAFRLLISSNMQPEYALALTHGRPAKSNTSKPVTQPKHELGDYWDEWMNSPERFDEERGNRL